MDVSTKEIHNGSISAVIIRADGTREELGMIASSRLIDKIRIFPKEKLRALKNILRG